MIYRTINLTMKFLKVFFMHIKECALSAEQLKNVEEKFEVKLSIFSKNPSTSTN
jgi:hypothetical protein